MASTWIHQWGFGLTEVIGTTTTEYFPLVGGSQGATTEANIQIMIRDTYTGSNLFARSPTNVSTGTTTIRTRKNAANGAQSVSFAALETGTKEDTTNTDAMATGELWNYSVANAGTGNITITILSALLQHSGTGTFIMGASDSASLDDAINYQPLTGRVLTQGTESRMQYTMRVASTVRNLRIYVTTNTTASATFASTRVNGGNGAQVATITAATTGSFENTTNSDTVTAGEEWNYIVDASPAKMGTTLTYTALQIEVNAVGKVMLNGFTGGLVLGPDAYYGIEGSGVHNAGSETAMQMAARVALSISNMCTNVITNPLTSASFYFRKNGVNAGPTTSYAIGETGIKEDTSNTTTVTSTDLINYLADATGTNMVLTLIGVETQQSAAPAGAAGLSVKLEHGLSAESFSPGLDIVSIMSKRRVSR